MNIYLDMLDIPGSNLKGENPQPRFREINANMYCREDGTLKVEEHIGYGVGCNVRTLPYRMQDRYDRSENMIHVKTIVMENDYLKATFLPEYGGKLWSLYAKDEGRELIFVNPVFRFANLANRNAWISGGIEWNLGHMGHHMHTSSDLYCAKVISPDGEVFLRMYEYEAVHAQFYQMDFHLPDGARQLGVTVRIQNARNVDSPLYWWTNTGVCLTETTRVFSGTSEIIYQLKPDLKQNIPGFGHCCMPEQPNMKGIDLSYPLQIPHALEYFFQNEKTQAAPWEVSIEQDGKGFMERSTQPLRIRKMFCWGNSIGGRHWCDYLSREGCGDYIELQAGLAPTQLHTDVLPANGVVMFTQLFGTFSAGQQARQPEWEEAAGYVEDCVEKILPASEVNRLHMAYVLKSTIPIKEILHYGDFYGGLEIARREKAGESLIVPHLEFPCPEPETDFGAWLKVLDGYMLPEKNIPLPYITDEKWLEYLEKVGIDGNAQTKFQMGVSLAENGKTEKAKSVFMELIEQSNPWAAHALASLYKRDGERKEAAYYYQLAYEWENGELDVSFAEEAMDSLIWVEKYEEAWDLFEKIPEEARTENELLLAAEAAVKLEKFDYLELAFAREYSMIREGATILSEIWYEYKSRLESRKKGIEYRNAQIDRSFPLPRHLNFLMW